MLTLTDRARWLKDLLRKKELFEVEPEGEGDPIARGLFASPAVFEMITDVHDDNIFGIRNGQFRMAIDAFIRGDRIRVSEQPFRKDAATFLARVYPPEQNIWDIRSFDAAQGIRGFGGFLMKDHLILLTSAYREDLDTPDDWADEVHRCLSEWRRLFVDIPPLSGGVHEHLTGNYDISERARRR